ncbi:MAG: hypothetical protein QOH25_528 [Acidobacteriota bacterium]|jgi:hypothetical protein|nr:hypothetical protein [Acidobacteriota bacterium]
MKQCPTCNRTYADDSITFCLADGALLSASYDPGATQHIPARLTNPPPTDVLTAQPPPTEVLPHYLQQAQRARANNSSKYLLAALLLIVVGGGILAVVLLNKKTPSASSSAYSSNMAVNTSATANVKPTETRAPTDYLRTPWLGLEVWQDGKANGLFKVDSYSTRVAMSHTPFEIRVPRVKDDAPLLVAASTNKSLFDKLKRGEKLDIEAESFFNPYKAMADTRAGSATLMLDDDAHYVYDEERLKPISDSLSTIFVSSILSDGAEQSVTSQKDDLYLVIFRDLDHNKTVDNGEYEFLILDF